MARGLTIWRTNRYYSPIETLTFAISRSQYPSQFSFNYSHAETSKRFVRKDQTSLEYFSIFFTLLCLLVI